MKDAAEPVRLTAEQLAAQRISHIGPKWERMRVGVTTRVVYVAPASRRRGGTPRPNLGGLLMDRAMQPALELKKNEVAQHVERVIDRLATDNGF